MSTNAAIGMVRKDGTVISTYCHWDGYLDGVGMTLYYYYKYPESVEDLINLGYLSSVGNRIEANVNEPHSYDNPVKDVTVAYHRDRDDKKVGPDTWASLDDYITNTKSKYITAAYVYVFNKGEWWVNSDEEGLVPMSDIVKAMEADV